MGVFRKAAFLFFMVHVFVLINPATALYFHMKHSDQKCFTEEIPDDTTIVAKYKVESWDQNLREFSSNEILGQGLRVEVKDPDKGVILSKVYSMKGRFTFTSHTPGEHVICLSSNTSDSHGWAYYRMPEDYDLRVHLSLRIGGELMNYNVVSQKEKLTDLQLRIRKLLDATDRIRKEQDYQRMREARFRGTSDSTNHRVAWFTVIQLVILAGTSYWQILNLKRFFIIKKLV